MPDDASTALGRQYAHFLVDRTLDPDHNEGVKPLQRQIPPKVFILA
jgi:hypothetical protein